MAMTRVHLLIAGEVQGVFYRASARDAADELGLTGWVRNLPTGEVEALVEGPEAGVERFIQWCWKGPSAASVSDVQVTRSEFRGDLQRFGILR